MQGLNTGKVVSQLKREHKKLYLLRNRSTAEITGANRGKRLGASPCDQPNSTDADQIRLCR